MERWSIFGAPAFFAPPAAQSLPQPQLPHAAAPAPASAQPPQTPPPQPALPSQHPPPQPPAAADRMRALMEERRLQQERLRELQRRQEAARREAAAAAASASAATVPQLQQQQQQKKPPPTQPAPLQPQLLERHRPANPKPNPKPAKEEEEAAAEEEAVPLALLPVAQKEALQKTVDAVVLPAVASASTTFDALSESSSSSASEGEGASKPAAAAAKKKKKKKKPQKEPSQQQQQQQKQKQPAGPEKVAELAAKIRELLVFAPGHRLAFNAIPGEYQLRHGRPLNRAGCSLKDVVARIAGAKVVGGKDKLTAVLAELSTEDTLLLLDAKAADAMARGAWAVAVQLTMDAIEKEATSRRFLQCARARVELADNDATLVCAAEDCLAALALDPQSHEAHGLFARVLVAQGELSEALSHVQLAGSSPDGREAARLRDAAEAHLKRALSAFLDGDMRKALAEVRKALKFSPRLRPAIKMREEATAALRQPSQISAQEELDRSARLAEKCILEGRWATALSETTRALECDKVLQDGKSDRRARLLLGRASALSKLGRFNEALGDMDEALSLPGQHDNFTLLKLRASLRLSGGDALGAFEDVGHVMRAEEAHGVSPILEPVPSAEAAAKAPIIDYYGTLRVKPTADVAIIRAAYFRLALMNHPSSQLRGTSEEDLLAAREQFEQVTRAFLMLDNPERRERYDRALATKDEVFLLLCDEEARQIVVDPLALFEAFCKTFGGMPDGRKITVPAPVELAVGLASGLASAVARMAFKPSPASAPATAAAAPAPAPATKQPAPVPASHEEEYEEEDEDDDAEPEPQNRRERRLLQKRRAKEASFFRM